MKLTATLALSLLVLVLAACATGDRVTPASAPVLVNPPPPTAVIVPPQSSVTVPPAAAGQGASAPQEAPAPQAQAAQPAAPEVVPHGTPGHLVFVPTAPPPLQAGYGRIEAIVPVPASAAAGGTAAGMHRVGIRMDNGSLQYVDTSAAGLSIGERVEITRDGYMKR